MTLATAMAHFRTRQAEQLTDRATIRRPTGEETYDEATGLAGQEMTTVGTNRPCKFVMDDRSGRDVNAAETTILVSTTTLRFTYDEDVKVGDEVTVTSSTYNATDIDRRWRVTDIQRHTHQIARNCTVEEIVAPSLNT